MSENNQTQNITSETLDCDPRSLQETLDSQYALQVALQTIEERCHQLQVRLAAVEEENLQLRLNKPSIQNQIKNDLSLEANSELEHRVLQLTRQKSKLSNHVNMVTQENQKLWTRLSRLTQANKSLGGHLTKISNTLNQYEYRLPNRTAKNVKPGECKELSLDEIPLKPVNSLIKENAELEQQYDQMVESIQSGTAFPIQNLCFAYVDREDESTIIEINKHCEKLAGIKRMLADQQQTLKLALAKQKTVAKGSVACSKCVERSNRPSKVQAAAKQCRQDVISHPDTVEMHRSQVVEPPIESEEAPEDRICPMCGKFYPKLRPFKDFMDHVTLHFVGEEDDRFCAYQLVE